MLLGDGTADQYGSVYVSAGIGNGYVVTDGPADYIYLTDALYRDRDQKFDRAISLFDNELNIQWPVPRMEMVLSQRDKQALSLEDLRAKGFDA
jgi:dTDP-4-dehydrorhamnose 3,5-epimerase